MPVDLTLLDGIGWRGRPISGDRPANLLACLALNPKGLGDAQLASRVWGDAAPAHPAKALQVLVSRLRSTCGPRIIERYAAGYRLGLATGDVDAWQLDELVAEAGRARAAGDHGRAVQACESALALAPRPPDLLGATPLDELRSRAGAAVDRAEVLLALALSASGLDDRALPLLVTAWAARPADEGVLSALLTSESCTSGVAAALGRYEDYRAGLRESLGTDPGPELQRLYRQLLAADSPVRTGVLFDGTELLGRTDELRQLQSLLRTGRVTSIVGPGGLGKTRLAHVLAREATQPRVHFVELVGVTSPDDVVAEVGAALGVRDSVTGRRTLTPAQRADVRGRLAQQLDTAPTLLVLDNCEHVVEAVASLVAFLVVTTRELHVLTTTRSPLNIAAERVFLLGELAHQDAVDLFERRARAARADVVLDPVIVGSIVERLDGLPLAIELAAARARAMSIEEIAARLEDRFALLRGRDRSAPDRHQTLLAVIDWSWNLLGERDRRALRWLSLFQDGCTLAAAESVLGAGALAAVESLTDQSLLSVHEREGRVRYRMLETVREFGRLHLAESGDRDAAEAAQDRWAMDACTRLAAQLHGAGQVESVTELRAEEINLADVVRRALAAPDPAVVVVLLAALADYWSITGNHARLTVLVDAAEDALRDWTPPDSLLEPARMTLALLLGNAGVTLGRGFGELGEILRRLGPGDQPMVVIASVLLVDGDHGMPHLAALEPLLAHHDRRVRMISLMWGCVLTENEGDPHLAGDFARRAMDLWRPSDGPWQRAMLQTQLSGLAMQMGAHAEGAALAREALPVLERLYAEDDALQMKSHLVIEAIAEERLDEAERLVQQVLVDQDGPPGLGGQLVAHACQAEIALAQGRITEGLELYRETSESMRGMRFPGMEPTGEEPWVMVADSMAVAAYARWADGTQGLDLWESLVSRGGRLLAQRGGFVDYPVAGLLMFALGTWGLFRGAPDPDHSVRLLVLAERFAYNRTLPTAWWNTVSPLVEQVRPGLIAALRQEYGDRRGPDLIDEAQELVERIG
ncbi:Signal transduction response regulator [metagenome]|uniref:Signal transduction response regulator n=1 Tax=metagenome TaxID=256318 RepID=A0A2P2CDI0_9ZZZZ